MAQPRYTERLHVLVTPKQKLHLERVANEKGVKPSELIRTWIDNAEWSKKL